MSDVVKTCKRTWRTLGVPKDVASDLAAELEADLAAAGRENIPPHVYVGDDVRGFAASWAFARGVVRPRYRLPTTMLAALVGAVPGVAFALFAAYGLSSDAIGDMFGEPVRVGEDAYVNRLFPPEWLYLAMYALGAVFAYAGAVAAVAGLLAWRLDVAARETARRLGRTLPVVTIAAVAATVSFSWTQEFSTDAAVVIGDVVVAASVFAFGVGVVRYETVRRRRRLALAV